MTVHPSSTFLSLGAITVPKCAKSVILPKNYLSTTTPDYLPGFGSIPAETKNNALLVVAGALAVGALIALVART